MKRETVRKAGMAVCIAVMLAGIVALVLYLGGFGEKITAWLPYGEDETENTTQADVTAEDISVSGPDGGLNFVVVEKGADFTQIESASYALSRIAEWGMNSVVFSECSVEELTQLVALAKDFGLYTVALTDASQVLDGGAADTASVKALIGTGIDSVLLDFSEGYSDREIRTASKAFRKNGPETYLGVYSSAVNAYKPVCPAGVFDYKMVDIFTPSAAVNGDYSSYLSSFIDGTVADTVFGMRVELVGNNQGFEKPEEILSQFETVTRLDFSGFGFYRFGVLERNTNGITDAILEYMQTGIMKDFFKELIISKPDKKSFKTDESTVSFVGTGDISQPLTLNGKTIEMIDDGYFSTDVQLKPGENIYTFKHKDKTVVYKITYDMELIRSVSPTGTVNAIGGSSLDIAVVAHKSATVTALINGKTISLKRSDEFSDDATADDSSDYTYFVGSYVLPEGKSTEQNIGKIKINASYSGVSQTVSGASVVVNAKIEAPPVVELPPDTTVSVTPVSTTDQPVTDDTSENSSSEEDGSSQTVTNTATTLPTTTEKPSSPTQIFELLTPYENNGVSGKSKMVVVKASLAETLPDTTTNDVSVPYFTPLPEGTVDYVTGTLSYSGINYYVLASGRRVYKTDVEYLSSGYNMPANEIKTVGVKKTSSSTDITFTTRWKVPFNVREKPQSFYEQTAGRPYSIKSFTAEYVDIVFYHTTKTDAAPQFNSNVIKKAEWINDGTTQTLRLYLNKKGGFYGIKYYYNSNGTLTFSIKERASSAVAGKVIMLDAGHGGNDPGAIGAAIVGSKNVYEATINLALANKIKAKLEALGATVIMTRTSATQTISLESRAAACRSKNPDIFVAVHCDASESQSPSGTTAYYYKSYSYPLADSMSKGIVSAYKNTVYANNSSMASKVDRGSAFKGFKVTRVEECPAVLIEFGYVTNVVECKALTLDENQNALAQGAVNGIVNYFKNS